MDQIDKQLVRKNSKINDHLLEELDTVASATECTGLIPTPPLSESEAEAYTDIYTIPKPENSRNNGLQQIEKKPHGKNRYWPDSFILSQTVLISTRKAWRQCRQAFLVFKNCANCL